MISETKEFFYRWFFLQDSSQGTDHSSGSDASIKSHLLSAKVALSKNDADVQVFKKSVLALHKVRCMFLKIPACL